MTSQKERKHKKAARAEDTAEYFIFHMVMKASRAAAIPFQESLTVLIC